MIMDVMVKPEFQLFDPAFDAVQAGKRVLVVLVAWDRMAFAVYDHDRAKFVALESFSAGRLQLPGQLAEALQSAVETSTLAGARYGGCRALWAGNQYTLVPNALFDPAHAATYLHFVHTAEAGSLIFYNPVKNMGAVNVFSIPSPVHELLAGLFPGHILLHEASVLAETLLIAGAGQGEQIRAFVNISAGKYDLIILKGRAPLLCNCFEYTTAEDFLYFLLYACDQLMLDPQKTPVTLIGNIERPSGIFELLKKYVRDVSFIKRSEAWGQSYVLDEIGGHRFFTMLNVLTCE